MAGSSTRADLRHQRGISAETDAAAAAGTADGGLSLAPTLALASMTLLLALRWHL
jgi:hypothetical protein